MSLSRRLSRSFSQATRLRGDQYFYSGRALIVHGTGDEVRAIVRGAGRYLTRISWTDGTVQLSCTCPAAPSSGPCKHAWATLRAAESAGHLTAVPPGFEPAEFVPQNPEDFLPRRREPRWKDHLAEMPPPHARPRIESWPERRQILYVIDVPLARVHGLNFAVYTRDRKLKGDGWTKLKELRLLRESIPELPDPVDREILTTLAGARSYFSYVSPSLGETLNFQYLLSSQLGRKVLPLACGAGRCLIRLTEKAEPAPIAWDDGDAWRFVLEISRVEQRWRVDGAFLRGAEKVRIGEAQLAFETGFLIASNRIAPLDHGGAFAWIAKLRDGGPPIEADASERDDLLAALLEHPSAPPVVVPEEARYEEAAAVPRPALRIFRARRSWHADRLSAEASFDYEGRRIPAASPVRGRFDATGRRFLRRDFDAEAARMEDLKRAGVRWVVDYYNKDGCWELYASKMPVIVRALAESGWQVEADGKIFRRPGASRLSIHSGIDWFDLAGEVDYDGATAALPALLAALKRGDGLVPLDDGTFGLLPEEWLARIGPVAGLGSAKDGRLRFHRGQAGLLDALLASRPDVSFDEGFARAREELRAFEGVGAAEQPAGFEGRLRDYQREGLGWMRFLDRFAFGGCLADDMGVGKTAQVLALLEWRRETGAGAPSLAVVPRSLVFNWKQEAERFAPRLRVLDHTGMGRSAERFAGYDLVLTTYGTLRRDAPWLQEIEFDYIILDEAQAIKNSSSESAKAARLLKGRRRLALSGTPIENHLGELWSLFEFLNPGMLGGAGVFQAAGGLLRNPDAETRQLLARALRPFILRRTKEQVAGELPPKTEQTIYCELKPEQRRLYDELRDHYRSSLLGRIAGEGLAKSKMQVLEALLRLRQAACHPGLIDPERVSEPSAKLDTLGARLDEVAEEGHKALVFSQFTTLLAIVRRRLDDLGVTYEYLDGRTRDRQRRVERFQNDSDCRLFLVSLKAGGLGLNLTAAEYVFLLDPWWNPAVEAQAVDRTHRIGQSKPVFAYRLIARDTVEEKVLELQRTKRSLADAILSADNSLIRDLKREDLELLLS
jgi:superfamily II DNA or RNA helicase